MPLSEHEKRLLAQMEEALAVDDPRLVSALTGPSKVSRNRVLMAIALVIFGIATLFAGLTFLSDLTLQMAIGLSGFLQGRSFQPLQAEIQRLHAQIRALGIDFKSVGISETSESNTSSSPINPPTRRVFSCPRVLSQWGERGGTWGRVVEKGGKWSKVGD